MGLFSWLFPQEEVAMRPIAAFWDRDYKRHQYRSWIYPSSDAIRDIKSRLNDLDKGREGILKAALSGGLTYGAACDAADGEYADRILEARSALAMAEAFYETAVADVENQMAKWDVDNPAPDLPD